jgi:hypothetical protein
VISHIELDWEIPSKARFFTRLASICRLFKVLLVHDRRSFRTC